MIIIYNLSGLLIGSAGAGIGLAVALASNRLGLGMLAMSAVWLGLGLWWRLQKTPDGTPHRYPAVFFIPLPFLAVPLAFLSVFILFVEQTGSDLATAGRRAGSLPADPRTAMFQADERALDASRFGGDVSLSEGLASALGSLLVEEAGSDQYRIFTRVNAGEVLVLIKAPNLKKYKENARLQLVRTIAQWLADQDQSRGKQVYIGVKGRLAFGVIRVPPDQIKTGSVLLTTPLLDFYGPNPAAPKSPDAPPAEPAATTGSVVDPSPPAKEEPGQKGQEP